MKRYLFSIVAALFVFGSTYSFTEAVSTLIVQQGGTGQNTFQAHTVLIGNGTSPIATTSPSNTGYVLTSNGVGSDPTFQPATGSSPGGLNLQVQYNNAGSFGGISGAVTNGTILNLTNPLIGGGTLTTSSVNGVTLTTGGATTSYLNASGAYSVPVGTTYTATYPVTLTGSAFGLAFGTTTSNTWAGTQTFTNQIAAPGGLTSNAQLNLIYSGPAILMQNTGATTDNKNWVLGAGATDFSIYALNDAGNASAKFISATRSGATITSISLPSLTGNGLVKTSGGTGTLSIAANGTDYSLITANTCSAGQFFSAATAAGVFTCSTPTSGGAGLATSSPVSAGNLLEYSSIGAGSAFGVATGTVSAGTGISATAGQSVIGSGLTITNTSPLSGLTATFPFSFTGGNTLGWLGLATSSNIVSGQPIYATGVNTIASVASSTFLTSIGGQATGNYITALTGDVTATGPGSVAATLATVNSNTGSWGSATQSAVLTLNGKGLTTAASSVTITPNFANVLGGTAGSVIYSNGTNLVQDNTNFFWDAGNHRLGLGTTTPATLLDVNGTGSFENQNGVRFYEGIANGVNYAALTATTSMAANVTWTLPGTDGNNGQFLTTNGSGNLYWATGGSGSSGGSTQGVQWATTAVLAGTPTYSNGSSGVGATLTEIGTGALSVDSNSPALNDRVLVKNQASAFQNGIFTVTATGSGIASYVLTRSTDYNTATLITPGITTYVISGTANTDTTWAVTYTAPLTIGTTNLSYVESAGSAPTITLSGDVSGSGTTAITTVIGALKVMGSMIANATIDLTTKVTGILPVLNGGTGLSAVGAANTVLTSNGSTLSYQVPSITTFSTTTAQSMATSSISTSDFNFANFKHIEVSIVASTTVTDALYMTLSGSTALTYSWGGVDTTATPDGQNNLNGVRLVPTTLTPTQNQFAEINFQNTPSGIKQGTWQSSIIATSTGNTALGFSGGFSDKDLSSTITSIDFRLNGAGTPKIGKGTVITVSGY